MNLDYYQYIVTTAECGSISKAAEKLHLRQQNLSSIIRKIEHYYGVTLFTRDTKGVILTKDGEYFLERARQILALAQELEQAYRYPSKKYYTSVVDHIILYLPDMLSSGIWVKKIKAFNAIFPYVELSMINRPAKEALALILSGEQGIAVVNLPFFEEDFFAQLPPELMTTPLPVKIHYDAITRRGNPEASKLSAISITDLLQKNLVLHSKTAIKDNIFYKLLQHYGTPKFQYVLDDTSLFIDFMQSDNYWSLAHSKQLQRYNLQRIPLIEDIYSTIYLIYHQNAAQSFIMQNLIKLLSEDFS